MQSTPLYHTAKGEAYVGNSLELLAELPDDYIDLVMTSPPFALRCQKSYGNVEETEYVQWIKPFGQENGGAIPSNLLSIPNTESNSSYLRICKELGIERHPARFPSDRFFYQDADRRGGCCARHFWKFKHHSIHRRSSQAKVDNL